MKKPCLKCGLPSEGSYCPLHAPLPYYGNRSKGKKQRGTTTERGYGTDHRAARKELAKQLPTACAYGCGRVLTEDTPWVAAHVIDGDPLAGWMASCVRCNEQAKRANIARKQEMQRIAEMKTKMCTLEQAPDGTPRPRSPGNFS